MGLEGQLSWGGRQPVDADQCQHTLFSTSAKLGPLLQPCGACCCNAACRSMASCLINHCDSNLDMLTRRVMLPITFHLFCLLCLPNFVNQLLYRGHRFNSFLSLKFNVQRGNTNVCTSGGQGRLWGGPLHHITATSCPRGSGTHSLELGGSVSATASPGL